MDDDGGREQLRESVDAPAALAGSENPPRLGQPGSGRTRRLLLIALSAVLIAVIAIAVVLGVTLTGRDSFAWSFEDVDAGGGTWTHVPLAGTGGNVTSLAIDPNNSLVVYAGTENGVFKSTDGARNWTQIMKSGPTLQSLEVSVFPDETSTLFVTNSGFVLGSVLMRSTDGGDSWENLPWGDFEASSWNNRTIRFGDLGAGPFMYVTDASAIDRDPDINKDKAQVWCSYDKGETWVEVVGSDRQTIEVERDAATERAKPVDPETGAELHSFIAAVHDPNDPSIVYAGTREGVYKSVDGGGTWARASEGQDAPEVASLVVDPNDASVLYAATGDGISKSTDGGETWSQILAGGAADALSQAASLVVAPSSSQIVYVWTFAGLSRSDDGGVSWRRLGGRGLVPTDRESDALTFAQLGPVASQNADVALALRNTGLFRTVDGGETWARVFGTGSSVTTGLLERDPTQPSTIYAAIATMRSDEAEIAARMEAAGADEELDLSDLIETESLVLKSMDDGATWTELAPGRLNRIVVDFDADPHDSSTLYVLYLDSTGSTLTGLSLSRSLDGGLTWHEIRVDGGETSLIQQLLLDQRHEGTFYMLVYTRRATGVSIYRSRDSGASWSDITGDLAGKNLLNMYIDPATDRGLYVTSPDGLFRWTPGSK